MIPIRSVLIEYENIVDNKLYANSGTMVADKYVIITSNVLVSAILTLTDIEKKLKALKSGFFTPETLLQSVPEVNIVINGANPYRSKRGKIMAIYTSERIRSQIATYFDDWTIDEDDKSKQIKEILSLFFIVAVDDKSRPASIDEFEARLAQIPAESVKVGDKIVIEGTPFGNRNFLKSRSRGIASNIFGTGRCFVLTDTPTAPGCEGSPIYLKTKDKQILPIGMVLASLSWWKGEWIGLTLGATFSSIFADPSPESVNTMRGSEEILNNRIHDVASCSLVRVISGANWGSGVLLDEENGVFVTNSHVVGTSSTSPILIWRDVEIKSKLVYGTAENEVYDLAVLIADLDDLKRTDMRAAEISKDEIVLGETVFAAGFPLFPKRTGVHPTVTKGHLSQITPAMIKTTCSILPGASGGAVLNKEGRLIGIITCNTRLYENMSVYPRVNMAIPIRNIIDVILAYVETKDARILGRLRVDNLSIKSEWNFSSSKL